jgi:hypothetical protein
MWLGLSLGRQYPDSGSLGSGPSPDLSPVTYYDQSPGQDGTLTVYNSTIESGWGGLGTGDDAVLGVLQAGTNYFIPYADWKQMEGTGYDGTANNEYGNFDPFYPNGTYPSVSVLYNQTAPNGTTGWQAIESFEDQPATFGNEFIRFFLPSSNLPRYKNGVRRPSNPVGYQDPIKFKVTGEVYLDSSGGGWNGTDAVTMYGIIGRNFSLNLSQNQAISISQEFALTAPLNESSNSANFNWASFQLYFFPNDTMETGAKFYFRNFKAIFYWE